MVNLIHGQSYMQKSALSLMPKLLPRHQIDAQELQANPDYWIKQSETEVVQVLENEKPISYLISATTMDEIMSVASAHGIDMDLDWLSSDKCKTL